MALDIGFERGTYNRLKEVFGQGANVHASVNSALEIIRDNTHLDEEGNLILADNLKMPKIRKNEAFIASVTEEEIERLLKGKSKESMRMLIDPENNFTYAEIAAIIGSTEKSVSSLVSNSINVIKKDRQGIKKFQGSERGATKFINTITEDELLNITLTDMEYAIAHKYISEGKRTQEIAKDLGLDRSTVYYHARRIRDKVEKLRSESKVTD